MPSDSSRTSPLDAQAGETSDSRRPNREVSDMTRSGTSGGYVPWSVDARPPFPVEIVRPKFKARQWIVMLLGSWCGVAFSAWTSMLLIGACHHEIDGRIPAFGYVQMLLGLYTLKHVFGAVSNWETFKLWSRERS